MMEEEMSEQPGESSEEKPEYGEPLDVSLIAKALVLFGLTILVIYLVLRYLAVTTFADDMWMATNVLQPGAFEGVVAVFLIFLFFGSIAYLIHLQFMKLALIAEEVLSTEYFFEEEMATLNSEDAKSS